MILIMTNVQWVPETRGQCEYFMLSSKWDDDIQAPSHTS